MDCLHNVQNVQKRTEASTCSPSTCLALYELLSVAYSSTAACAAAKRAIGTRNGEHDA